MKKKQEYPWPVRIDLVVTIEQALVMCAVAFIAGIAVTAFLIH